MEGLERLVRNREASREEARRLYAEECRERLRRILTGKVRTTMVGAVVAAEDAFGFLAGLGPVPEFFTDAEAELIAGAPFRRYMRDAWEAFRTAVFDLGNDQIWGANAELDQYEVGWRRYRYQVRHRENDRCD